MLREPRYDRAAGEWSEILGERIRGVLGIHFMSLDVQRE
jgi:hypothetical protein